MSAPSLSTAIARRLQELRLRAGVPLSELARRAGLTATALREIEEGRAAPNLGTLAQIAAQLGASLADLVREARQPPAGPISSLA